MSEISPEQMVSIVNSSLSLMRDLTDIYGNDRGIKLWDTIAENLGDEIKGEIFFGMISGKYSGTTVNLKSVPQSMKVSAIKAIKTATGLGLKESKDLTDLAQLTGKCEIKCPSPAVARHLKDELNSLGCNAS